MSATGFEFIFSQRPPEGRFTKLKPVVYSETDKTYYVYVEDKWRPATPTELEEIESGRELS